MSIDSQLEVSVGLTQAILEALRGLGVSDTEVETLLEEAGIGTQLLGKPENRIPFEQQQAFWALAIERANTSAE
jgi:hypothetical protein